MDIQLLLQNNLLLISLLGLFSIILSTPNYVSGLFTLVTVLLLSYFLHLFSHFNTPIINILSNTHTKYHHSKEKNKYMFYAHFGNFIGLQSYVYDRSKRRTWKEERERWLVQFKELELFKKEFTNSEFLFKKALEMQGLNY